MPDFPADMDPEGKTTFKEKLGERLAEYPLLRQLIFEFWFLLIFGLIVLASLTMAVCLPKMWRVSPPGFLPIIRISVLDMVQAWSLRRSAERAAAAGQHDEADYAWQSAIANNPADPDLYRGVLRHSLEFTRPTQKNLSVAVNQTHLLLRLSNTNLLDIELTARVYEKFHFHEWVLELLEPYGQKARPPLDGLYLRALFHAGRIDQFAGLWDQLAEASRNDPRNALYHSAYLAGWSKPATARPAKEKLQAALENSDLKVTACRLQMLVCIREEDASGYQAALERLVAWHQETLLDKLGYWQLLVTVGRRTEAKELALAYSDPPGSPLEAYRLASVFVALGMSDHALEFLAHFTPEFRYFAPLWLLYSDLLVEAKRWEEVQRVAADIRRQEYLRQTLAGFAYYLEGRADLALNQKAAAGDAFREAGKLPYGNPQLGLAVAGNLSRFGYPADARAILAAIGKSFPTNAAYWNAVALAAYGLRDAGEMLRAAKTAYDLQSDNASYINNYAAALLFGRQHPEEAVTLTLRLVAASPNSIAAQLNHCLALILSRRLDEAEKILQPIETQSLPPAETTSAHYARYEIEFLRNKFDRAKQASERIDRQFLFPPQIEWLDRTLAEITKRTAKKV
ncbi:MAG: hypothetical protein HY043_02240 [Verrucomicrobia bacterium]|nr:hypothetical protein [Verrucomicrobiota bacterium]